MQGHILTRPPAVVHGVDGRNVLMCCRAELEVALELALHVVQQAAAFSGEVLEKRPVVLLDELIEQRLFRSVPDMATWA